MILIKDIAEIPKDVNFALTIGNFDGVHMGHQFLLKSINDVIRPLGKKLVIVTFVPHPQVVLRQGQDQFLINTYLERRELLKNSQVDYLIEINFNRDLSTLSAEDFLLKYVCKHKGLSAVYLGHDFSFGANKMGTHEKMQQFFQREQFKNITLSIELAYIHDKNIISSSLIRKLLREGDIEKVSLYLGRNYKITNSVIRGDGRGKKIGFATANIVVPVEVMTPALGVYISLTKIDDRTYQSVTNVGARPTFKEQSEIVVETNLFDFNEDIYGKKIEVLFLKRLRSELKFDSVNKLVDQIHKDVTEAKNYHHKI